MTLARRPGLASHIEGCDECRVLVAAVRRASLVDSSEVVMPAPIPAEVTTSEATPGDAVLVVTPGATRGGRALLIAACACVLVLLGLLVRLAAH